MRVRRRPGWSMVHLSVLLLLVGAADAGEELVSRFSMTPEPARAAIGTDTLVTWTITDVLPSGALVDVVLTQDDVDRFIPRWQQEAETGNAHVAMGPVRSAPSRSLRLADDECLAYPIEVILPGWQILLGDAQVAPGTYRITWLSGAGLRSTAASFTVDAPVAATPASRLRQMQHRPLSYGLEAAFLPGPVVRTTEDLSVRITRIAQEHDRPEVWRSAVVEWTRLPDQPGAATRIYSPIQAGLAKVEARQPGPASPPAARDLRIPVADAVRDPISGTVVPGLYRLRLAMAWSETIASPTRPDHPMNVLYSIRSPGQLVRILAPGEEPPPTCPICGTVRSGNGPEQRRP